MSISNLDLDDPSMNTPTRLKPGKFWRKQVGLLFIAGMLFISSVSGLSVLFGTTNASAVTTAASKGQNDLDWQIKSFLYYRTLSHCMANSYLSSSYLGTLIPTDLSDSVWWRNAWGNTGPATPVMGLYMRDSQPNLSVSESDGKVKCDNPALVPAAMAHWGLKATDVLCESGFRRVDFGVSQTIAQCKNEGTTAFEYREGGRENATAKFKAYIKNVVYGNTDASKELDLSAPQWYIYYQHTLANSCITKIEKEGPSGGPYGNDNKYGYNDVKWVDINKLVTTESIAADQGITTGSFVGNWPTGSLVGLRVAADLSNYTKNCTETVVLMNGYAKQFAEWVINNKEVAVGPTLPGTDSGSVTPGASSCSVEGIGWILCPLAGAMAGLTDALFEAVKAFLNVAPLSLDPNNNPLYTAWSTMRTIANVAFVIVFLIIIFSQLSSAGVSNYGVKKLLPRLVVGAIMVNLSFFICAVAVDLSNILGVTLQDVFKSISASAANTGETGENWASITTAVIAGGGTIAAGAISVAALSSVSLWGVLAGLLPMLVGALTALIIAFLVLLARQALIIMLIVLSPLAFVAFLLPNTEGLFKKWKDLFVALLVLFPMISLVFGGSGLAAVILRGTSKASMEDSPMIGFFLYIGSFAVMAIPLFITPLLVKLSGGVLNRFAGLVNNKNKGPLDRLRKGGERIAKDAQNRGYANKVGGKGIMNFGARRRARVSRVSSGLENTAKYNENEYINHELGQTTTDANGDVVASPLASKMAAGSAEGAVAISQKAIAHTEAEELKEALEPLRRQLATLSPGDKQDHLDKEILAGGPRAAAAAFYRAQIGDDSNIRAQLAEGQRLSASTDPNKQKKGKELLRITRQAIDSNSGALLGKAPDLVKGAGAAFGSVKGADMAGFSKETARAYMAHIKTLEATYSSAPVGTPEHADAKKSLETAITGFNSAVQDIQSSPELQSKFSAETGTTLTVEHGSLSPSIAGLVDISAIQADGKIR